MFIKQSLKPCPFCGGIKIAVISKKTNICRNQFGDFVEYRIFSARCTKCHARGSAVGGLCSPSEKMVKMYGKETHIQSYKYYQGKAIEAWNRRTYLNSLYGICITDNGTNHESEVICNGR